MFKKLILRRGVNRARLAPSVFPESRHELVCDAVCNIHECVISGCVGTDTVGYLMDRLLSLEPRRHAGDRR